MGIGLLRVIALALICNAMRLIESSGLSHLSPRNTDTAGPAAEQKDEVREGDGGDRQQRVIN